MLICSPVLQRLREENLEFEKGLGGTARLSLKTTKTVGGGGRKKLVGPRALLKVKARDAVYQRF